MSANNHIVFEAGWSKVLASPKRPRLKAPLTNRTRDAYKACRKALLDGGNSTLNYPLWRALVEGRDAQLDLFTHSNL